MRAQQPLRDDGAQPGRQVGQQGRARLGRVEGQDAAERVVAVVGVQRGQRQASRQRVGERGYHRLAVAEPAEDVAEDVEEDVEEAVAEEEEQPIEIEIATAPIDGRFPGTNQARACFVKYNEAHKCMGEKGEDDSDCKRLARDYRAICPVEWLEKWNEARDEGAWFGKY